MRISLINQKCFLSFISFDIYNYCYVDCMTKAHQLCPLRLIIAHVRGGLLDGVLISLAARLSGINSTNIPVGMGRKLSNS